MPEANPFFVDADWLQDHLGTPGLSIVDASWYLPAQNRNARDEYDAAHIPGAVFFDQDAVVDPEFKPAAYAAGCEHLCPPCRLDGHFGRRHDRGL